MKTVIVLILSALCCCAGEIVVGVKSVLVTKQCDEAGCKGDMRHTGAVLTSWPPRYPHICFVCRVERVFREVYPTYRFEPMGSVTNLVLFPDEPFKITTESSTNWTGVNSGTNELGYVVTNHIANIEYQGSNYTFQLKSVPTDKAVWREKETIGYATNITVQPWLEFTNNIHWRAL